MTPSRPALAVLAVAWSLSACAEERVSARYAPTPSAALPGGVAAQAGMPYAPPPAEYAPVPVAPAAPPRSVYAPPSAAYEPPAPPPAPPPTPYVPYVPPSSGTPTPALPAGLPPGAQAAGTSDSDPLYRDLVGQPAPELAADGTWIRSASGASLASMRGQVVYLQFAFLGCGACSLIAPHVKRWHESYGPMGLVVIDVDNGLKDHLEPAKKAWATLGTPYPIFHDTSGKTIATYGMRSFPTVYLVGKDGRVLWNGNPVGAEEALEAAIVAALK